MLVETRPGRPTRESTPTWWCGGRRLKKQKCASCRRWCLTTLALAAVATWEALWRLVRPGTADRAAGETALLGRVRAVGPIAAAVAGLRDAGLVFDGAELSAAAGERLDPFTTSLAQLRRFLVAALQRYWWDAVRARRQDTACGGRF